MTFYLSKLVWLLANPLSLTIILLTLCLLLALLRWRRTSFAAGLAALLVIGVSSWTTTGAVLIAKLEDRFQRPATAPAHVDGIIVLGGAFEARVSDGRGGYEMNEAGDRMVEAAGLALAYPGARIIVSGGNPDLFDDLPGDATIAPRFFERMGIDPARLMLEGQSRNTVENVAESMRLAKPGADEVWLLVTSAFHMPRSVALFRKAGWPVIPWPSDYRSAGTEGFGFCGDDAGRCLRQASVALREWIGLVSYWAMGRIDEPFPSR